MNKYDEMYMSNPVGFGWTVVMVVSAVTAYQVSGNETVAAITWGVCTLGYLFYWLKLKEVWGF